MIQRVQCILIGIVILMLTGCAYQMERIEQKREQARCDARCVQTFRLCDVQCTQSYPKCVREANAQAEIGYAQYLAGKKVQGGIVMHDFNSYRDPLQCSKSSCDCLADYRLCVQSCSNNAQQQ